MLLPLAPLTVFLACLSAGYCLQPSEIPQDAPLSSLVSSAKSHLASGSARDALLFFDAAIARDPANFVTIFQRGAAYLSLGKSSQASDDFDKVLKLKPDFEGALLQRARLRIRIADWTGAMTDLEKAGKKSSEEYREIPGAREAARLAQNAEKKGDWEACVRQADIAITKANAALSLRQTRAHCRFEKGDTEDGISELTHILQLSPGLVEPHLQMSSALFYVLGETERGTAQIRKCLHSDPDSKECNRVFRRQKRLVKRLNNVRENINKRKFANAASLLVGTNKETGLIDDVKSDTQQAIEAGLVHPSAPSRLYMSLVEDACEAYRQTRSFKKAQPYCSESLRSDPNSLAGLLFKAQVSINEDEFEEAKRVLNKAKEHHSDSDEINKLLQETHKLLKLSKQKDYYKVLGVGRDADERTIKRAYRTLTKEHHPDKATSRGVAKEDAEKKMAAINEAYEVLSTPELKERFDNGDDPNDPQPQGGDAFQGSPFGHGGGGQHFFFQQGGPKFRYSSQGSNFFNGFPFP